MIPETQAVDIRRWCGHIVPIPSMSEFPDATSFLVLVKFSWKFRRSWSFPAATKSPRTLVHLCIFLPHLRTRRCILIRFSLSLSLYKFPCTLPILLTGCPECPRTFRCNWTLQSRRTCRSMRDQVQRRL